MPNQPATNDPSDSARRLPENAPTVALSGDQSKGQPMPTAPSPIGSSTLEQSVPPLLFSLGSEASKKPPSLIGLMFGDLQILEELGRGGMGVVFKARQLSLDRMVAVKMLLREQYTDPMRVARFQAEARAAAKLEHDHIVKVYQVGECEAGHYISMEYIEGESLEAWVRKGRMSFNSCIMVTCMIAEAIQHAHSQGVVHRDLKPANILIDRKHRPVITDFGIAKLVGQESRLTQKGDILGTPAFMSPEQAGQAPDAVGPRSDIYAIGAIMYMLLTGRPPFDEGNALRTVLKLIGPDMPPPIRNFRPNVPHELEAIVLKCMQKRPEDRFASAEELAHDLRSLHKRLRRGEVAPEPVESPPTPVPNESADLGGMLDRNLLQQMTGSTGPARTNTPPVRKPPPTKEHLRLRDDHVGEYGSSLETPLPSSPTSSDSRRLTPPPVEENPSANAAGSGRQPAPHDSVLDMHSPEGKAGPGGSGKRHPTPVPGDPSRKSPHAPEGAARALVAILVSESSGQQIRLKRSQIVIGRAPDCNLVIKSSDVSKQHCRITVLSDQVIVEDLGSANGTYVNEKETRKATLRDRDKLRLGEHVFVVRIGYAKSQTT